jgi:two-component SAPR family response regulator
MLKEHEIGMDIQKINEGYRLDTANLMYDVLAFEQSGSSIIEVMQDVEKAEHLCSLYKGLLLERKDYTWKAAFEEGYGKQYMLLVRSLIEHDLAKQEWAGAERRLDAYLSLYPLDEEMNQLLMDIYASCGYTEKMKKHFARFEASYRREIGQEPPEGMRSRIAPYLI